MNSGENLGGWDATDGRGAVAALEMPYTAEMPYNAAGAEAVLTAERGEFTVDVRSEPLREALVAIGRRGGWTFKPRPSDVACLVLDRSDAENVNLDQARVVLAADPVPASAREVLKALESGRASAAFLSDEPADLLIALDAARNGWSTTPARLVEMACRMPELNERQLAVVRAVMAGQDNRAIAQGLYLSPASVKRELAGLFRLLKLGSRVALAAEGAALGLTPKRAVT